MIIQDGKVVSDISDAANRKISTSITSTINEIKNIERMVAGIKPVDQVGVRNLDRAKKMAKSAKTSLEALKMVVEAFN